MVIPQGCLKNLQEIRCKRCKRLLMKGEIVAIEIKCPKCGYIQTIYGKGGDSDSKCSKSPDLNNSAVKRS